MANVDYRQFYLVLSQDDKYEQHTLTIMPTVGAAVEQWVASTRISPVFLQGQPADGSGIDALLSGRRWLVFLGLVQPNDVRLAVGDVPDIWLSLGAFNVIVNCPSEDIVGQLTAWAIQRNLRGEIWEIQNSVVSSVKYVTPTIVATNWRDQLSVIKTANIDRELIEVVTEYLPLMASGFARCERVMPELLPDLVGVSKFVATRMNSEVSDDDTNNERLAMLTTLNAGLSRFTSQAFSGTSPIQQTECHFWTHSLLGTAVANRALWRLSSFVVNTFGRVRLAQRFAAYATDSRALDEYDLASIDVKDEFWFTDHLKTIKLSAAEMNEPLLPLIAHFSGRDGFKSTIRTISAPLAVIGSCNSTRWTLLTLTHEITHALMRGLLAELLPVDGKQYTEFQKIINGTSDRNWLNAIRKHVLLAILSMDRAEAQGRQSRKALNTETLRRIVDRWYMEVTEILVHVFDFLYFYDSNPEKYVKGIWLSWSTVPDLIERVPEYVMRTMCALMAKNLRRGDKKETIAKKEFLKILNKLPKSEPGAEYIDAAKDHLNSHWNEILKRLAARLPLIQITRAFLFSQEIHEELHRETQFSPDSTRTGGYGLRPGEFDGKTVDNPLRFVETYTRASLPNSVESLWLMYVLGFDHATSPRTPTKPKVRKRSTKKTRRPS